VRLKKNTARNGLLQEKRKKKRESKKSAFPDLGFLADANMLKRMLQLHTECTVPTASTTQLVHHQISAHNTTSY